MASLHVIFLQHTEGNPNVFVISLDSRTGSFTHSPSVCLSTESRRRDGGHDTFFSHIAPLMPLQYAICDSSVLKVFSGDRTRPMVVTLAHSYFMGFYTTPAFKAPAHTGRDAAHGNSKNISPKKYSQTLLLPKTNEQLSTNI